MDDSRLKQRLQEGQALVRARRLEEAERHYLDLLADYPGSGSAHLHLGNIYILQRRWSDAIDRLRAGTAIDPASIKLRTSLARAHFNNDQVSEAILILERVPKEGATPKSLLLLLQCHMKAGNWPAAVDTGTRLLELLPSQDPAAREAMELRDDALAEIEFARFNETARSSGFASALEGLRDVANRARLTQRIIATYDHNEVLHYVERAIASGKADADCHHWLGKIHYNDHKWEAALKSADNALALDPLHKSAQFLLAKALMRVGRLSEAVDQLNLLLSIDPNRTAALQLKADIFVRLARVDDAIRLYRTALRKDPDNPLINYRLSNALLLKGDIAGYHRLHEYRRKLGTFTENNKDYQFQDWNGELHIDGKLLVWSEFGLGVGQNILHMTFLNSLVAIGLEVVFEVEPRLVKLCERSFPEITVIPKDAELPEGISHHTPVASLGRWFKPDLASFASMRPYFLPDAQAAKALRVKLQNAAGEGQLLVGVSWTSNNPLVGDVKSVPLDQLLSALTSANITLVDLQYGDHSANIRVAVAETGTPLVDSGIDTSNDLDGLAALVAALDLVVCIGHTTAHMAGAVGTPNFVLLPVGPFAHWLGQGKNCIWYPASRLLRQAPFDHDWRPVLAEVREAVDDFRSHYRPEHWLSTSLLGAPQPSPPTKASDQDLHDAVQSFSAQGAYRSALELIDRIPPAEITTELQIKRADMLAQVGRWEEARATYAGQRTKGTFDVDLETKLLSVCLEMYDLEGALAVAIALAEEVPALRMTVANILHRLRRNGEALRELRGFSTELPEVDGLSTLAATILLELGEFKRAETYLAGQVAVKGSPQDYSLLGRAFSTQGRQEEAIAAYGKALSLSRSHPSANFWRTLERVKIGKAALVPLPPLKGEIPSTSKNDLVLFFVADSSYFWRHGLVLLESTRRNSPGVSCHVHVINPDEGIADQIEVVRTLPGLSRISYSYEHNDFDGCGPDHIRTYYASIRFVRLAEVFARSPANYLCVDADCIVRKNLLAATTGLSAGDVAIRMRYDDRPNLSVAAGALMLRPTPAAEAFIRRVADLIRTNLEAREAAWFLDQVVLSHVVREAGENEVAIDQLDMSYIDWLFDEESLIWTGKGKRKSEDSRYTREAAKYERLTGSLPANPNMDCS